MFNQEKFNNAYYRMDDAIDQLDLRLEQVGQSVALKEVRQQLYDARALLAEFLPEMGNTLPEYRGEEIDGDYHTWAVANNID